MEHYDLHQFNTWAKEHITDENRFDDNGFIIMENETIHFYNSLISWKNSILTSFNRIPIICPKFGHLMDPVFKVS